MTGQDTCQATGQDTIMMTVQDTGKKATGQEIGYADRSAHKTRLLNRIQSLMTGQYTGQVLDRIQSMITG
jgi:hypothetical protein